MTTTSNNTICLAHSDPALDIRDCICPELVGSERQIAWAKSIRSSDINGLAELAKLVELGHQGTPEGDPIHEAADKAAAKIQGETSAKWWIEEGQNMRRAFAAAVRAEMGR